MKVLTPSAKRAAKILGVADKDVKELHHLAQTSSGMNRSSGNGTFTGKKAAAKKKPFSKNKAAARRSR